MKGQAVMLALRYAAKAERAEQMERDKHNDKAR
jgi:hypothetical protein